MKRPSHSRAIRSKRTNRTGNTGSGSTAVVLMFAAAVVFGILSYGFIDPNLKFVQGSVFAPWADILTAFVYGTPKAAAALYAVVVLILFACYGRVLTFFRVYGSRNLPRLLIGVMLVFLLSYPALSYDIFNYILTAKVTYLYRENPYIIMPIEIPNEPGLAYTRAANNYALYGPTWIVLTSLPHLLGSSGVYASILSFKFFVGLFYAAMGYLIYRKTKRMENAAFFLMNPLVLTEVLSSGHNDIVMMVFAVAGILLWQKMKLHMKIAGAVLFLSSVFVKGATIALLPLFFLPSYTLERKARVGFSLMFLVFLLGPLREELYPWYAVWWLTFAAFIPMKANSFIHEFSIWASVFLALRYIPWIATREYGGMTPVIRESLTIVPMTVYLLIRWRKKLLRHA